MAKKTKKVEQLEELRGLINKSFRSGDIKAGMKNKMFELLEKIEKKC